MPELLAQRPETPAIPEREAEASRVEEEAPEGWRVVWLPRHGVFLAYLDVDMPEGFDRPAVSAETAQGTLEAIATHRHLAGVVREWLGQHIGGAP
jgi:hypothetical protein